MREVTTTLYSFSELSDDAQERALEKVQELLSANWDPGDNEQIADDIVYELAHVLGEPSHAEYGQGDYPGIPHVKLHGWDVGRGQSLSLEGVLDRENAPALPWCDGIDEVMLDSNGGRQDHTHIGLVSDEDESSTEAGRSALFDAVRDAMASAVRAGADELTYLLSAERAQEWIDLNEPEFFEDGGLA